MSRLAACLIFGLSLLIGGSAFGWQDDSNQLFPTSLSQAIDNDAVQPSANNKRIAAPWRANPVSSAKSQVPVRPGVPIAFPIQKPAFSVAAIKPTIASKPQEPKRAQIPSVDNPRTEQVADFGTVMMFRADDEPEKAKPLSNVYRAPSQFKLASAPINPKSVVRAIVSEYVLRLSVVGPDKLVEDTAEEFEIIVANTSMKFANDIVIQMSVSEDLTVTDVDRKAWMDGENRTVSWKINLLAPGAQEVIRFRAVSASQGRHVQNVSMGMANTFQGRADFAIVVVENSDWDSLQQPKFEN